MAKLASSSIRVDRISITIHLYLSSDNDRLWGVLSEGRDVRTALDGLGRQTASRQNECRAVRNVEPLTV